MVLVIYKTITIVLKYGKRFYLTYIIIIYD